MAKKTGVARTRRSEDEWRELIAAQAASGVSQRAFCKSRGLSLSSLTNARRRFGARGSSLPVPEFVPVAWEVTEPGGWEVELALGDGLTLRFRRA